MQYSHTKRALSIRPFFCVLSQTYKKNAHMDIRDEIAKTAELTRKSCIEKRRGGPFGAFIFDEKSGKTIARGFNRVTSAHDPTAHAEIEAIRAACKKLKTHDLSGLSLYATGFPCPMCLSAAIWANIKNVYYSKSYADAAKIGFRDDSISNFIKGGLKNSKILKISKIKSPALDSVYDEYRAQNAHLGGAPY